MAAIGAGSTASQPRTASRIGGNAVVIFFFACYIAGASAQGLIVVPNTVTRELGGYYLSKLGLAENGMDYYSILSQRNTRENAYSLVNDLDTESPREAAAKMSNVRGVHVSHSLGGKITVEGFYRLLRCEDTNCFTVNRLVAADFNDGAGGTVHALSVVKTTMGDTGWLVNAPQFVVNGILAQPEDLQLPYMDNVYKTKLFYKVAAKPPPPCSPAAIQTFSGSISEFQKLPGFACINYDGTILLVGTQDPSMVQDIHEYAVPSSQCDGTLGLLYVDGGPQIFRTIRAPGQVPLGIFMLLPKTLDPDCSDLYDTPMLTIQAAANIQEFDFDPIVNPTLPPIPAIAMLGFSGKCAPRLFASGYGLSATGQNEALADGVNNRTFTDAFVPYNPAGVCVSMLGSNDPGNLESNFQEDQCAGLFLGNPEQQREAVITYRSLNPGVQPTERDTAFLQSECGTPAAPRYSFDLTVVLPQIAADFQTDKNFLVSSTEVKTHLDGVAANAASVLAVEAALATSGIVVARTIARTGLYRRRRVPSNLARALALFLTAIVVTLFNVPNFALISRSLANHGKTTVYTQASVRQYRPTNFSAVLMAETHSFVEVTGSSATAAIGLLLYCATMIFCLYLTWAEFTEIIQRRQAAESRLGQDALIADKDLLVQWRGTDSLVYDTLHPKKVVESAQAQELEIFRRNLAITNPGPVRSPQGPRNSPLGTPLVQRPGHTNDLYPESRHETPDLYPEV